MNSFHPSLLDSLTLDQVEVASIKVIEVCRGRQQHFMAQLPDVLESLRSAALIESTESSNRLEGIVTSRERLQGLMLKSTQPRNRNEEEIAAYRDALASVHGNPNAWGLNDNTLLQLHAALFRQQPGEGGHWKRSDNVIVERRASGETFVRFRPTPAAETARAVEQLVLGFQHAQQERVDPLVCLSLAVLDFLCIHPFSDGNGRVSRLLTLALAYQLGYDVGRYISLERIIEQTKDRYYENLRLSSQGWHEHKHDVHPFLNYLLFVLARAYSEFEQRVQDVREGKGAKSQLVANAIQMQLAQFSLAQIQALCPAVSQEQIKLVMRKLKAEGKIKSLGRGRDARWIRNFDAPL